MILRSDNVRRVSIATNDDETENEKVCYNDHIWEYG